MFLQEKRDNPTKGRVRANGRIQESHVPKEEFSSPTAITDSLTMTSVTDTKQERNSTTMSIPSMTVQTEVS